MSQSSKKGNIIFVGFLLLLVLIAGLITYYLIYNHNLKASQSNHIEENYLSFKKVEESKTLDIFRKYPVNPITVTVDDDVKISGLKDKNVENKINSELKSFVPYDAKKFGVRDKNFCNINFNFSNVLSLECENKSGTFDLTTGNYIKIEDIFNKDTDLFTITMDALYQTMCEYGNGFCTPEEDDDEYYKDNEYYKNNKIENEIANVYHQILQGNYGISLEPTGLWIKMPNFDYYVATIDFTKYYNEVTIFDRYKTKETIYENDIEQYCNIMNCDNSVEREGYFLSDKNYLNIRISSLDENIDLAQVKSKIVNEIIKKNSLKKETNNYQYLSLYITIEKPTYGYNVVSYTIYKREMDKDNFIKYYLDHWLDVKIINEEETEKINMILTNDNNIVYLEDDPNKVFNNFYDTLANYLLEYIENDRDSIYDYNSFCNDEGYADICNDGKIDYQAAVKQAIYAIDIDNKLLMIDFMIYALNTIEVPYDIFTLK